VWEPVLGRTPVTRPPDVDWYLEIPLLARDVAWLFEAS
jgi:hypothetical protein